MKGGIVCPSEDLSLRRVIMGLQLEGHGGEQRMGQRAVERSGRGQEWGKRMQLRRLAPKLRRSFEEEGKAHLLTKRMRKVVQVWSREERVRKTGNLIAAVEEGGCL